MELLLSEQDLIDSVCVYAAAKEYTNPESIDVDLAFNPSFGFSATADVRGRFRNLNEQDLIDAVAVYLRDYHNFDPDRLAVDLRYTENVGITASVLVR
ncbi:DUF2653 family protein [Bacillus sp. BRMEA1]|uniref:DUF2653 family protein n=1 Tax=Neobacillus endophyticus TaxID=2738405 RepID=UPI001563CD70|nr:DUF2653 family protein [Neobacillus endophyticus]NRD76799.1 DUF2653 family protein [Neobacillus endophyticus]